MRILHVVCSDRFAGVERHVAQLAAAQAQRGASVAVLGGQESPMRRDIAHDEVVFRPVGGLLGTIRTARPFVLGADIVHVHMTASEIAGVIAAVGAEASVVTTRHFADPRGRNPLNRWVGRRAAARIDAQIAVSDFAARHVEGPSTVIHAGVPARPGVDPMARGRTVLVAQRLEAEKGTDLALDVFAASGLAAQGWRLLVAGDGALKTELERRAERLAISCATQFLGYRSDIDELMTTAGILFAPGSQDAYGLSVVEAMAVGLPVVATAAGGHLETVGSVAGAVLVPTADVATGAAVLAELAADAVARAAYGDRLRSAQRERFTLSAQERATDAVYRSVL